MKNIIYVFGNDRPNVEVARQLVVQQPVKIGEKRVRVEFEKIKVKSLAQALSHYIKNQAQIEQVFLSASAPHNAREYFGGYTISNT